MPPPAGSSPPRERHSRATECARLIPVTTSRDSWRSHVHRTYIPQAAQLFEPKTANVRGRGGSPLVFLSGDLKGDTLFEKRVSPFVRQWRSAPHYPCSAAHCNLPSPAKAGNQKGQPLRKESIPLCPAVALSAALSIQRSALQPPIPRKEGNQKGYPLRKESIPL